MSTSHPVPSTTEVENVAPNSERLLREKGIATLIATLISCGFGPAAASSLWALLLDIQHFAVGGLVFAILSYFFYDGTYLGMLGLYIAYQIDVIDRILYELIVLLPTDVPFSEVLPQIGVTTSCSLFGTFYLLTAIILESFSLFMRLLFRIHGVAYSLFIYFVTSEVEFIYGIGMGTLPWYLKYPLGLLLIFQSLSFGHDAALAIVRKIVRVLPDDLAIGTLRLAILYLPQIGRGILNGVQRTKRIVSWFQEFLLCRWFFPLHSMPWYAYNPLHTGEEIRLLCLSGEFWGLEIRGKLVPIHIDKLPNYECISHRWGDLAEEKIMSLNGRKLKITLSVYNILRQRRAFFSSRLIWIDSVCINQDDPIEKSHQVRKMHKIYAKAARVTVCLGDSPDAHLARTLIRTLYHHIILSKPQDWTDVISMIYTTSEIRNDMNEPPEWLALKKLLRNPWFERCWVVQEVVLASKVYVTYGGKYIDWKNLLCVINAFMPGAARESSLIRTLLVDETGNQEVTTMPVGLLHPTVMEDYRRNHREGLTPNFHHLLEYTSTFKAADPRDKIFALQGFTDAANALPIDYELTLEEILINTARYLMKTPEGIEVLQQAGIGWRDESGTLKIPSWAVDWSKTRPTASSAISFRIAFRIGDWCFYRAAVERQPEIQEMDSKTIELRGLHLDYIKTRGMTMQNATKTQNLQEVNDEFMLFLREAQSIVQSLPREYHPTGQWQFEAFWRTCIGDRHDLTRPADPDYGEKFLDFKQATIRKYAIDHLDSTPGPKPLSENDNLLREEGDFLEEMHNAGKDWSEHCDAFFDFGNAFGCVCRGRCFAVTEKGYMVIAPPGAREGDMLGIVMGAQTPFLLRPLFNSEGEVSEQGNFYALVGECYVHGLMDGEGLRLGLDEGTFLIR